MTDRVMCEICQKMVSSKSYLRRHILKTHPASSCSRTTLKTKSVNCPLCNHSSEQYPALLSHFSQEHDLSMKEEAHDFLNTGDFLKWKQAVEKSTKSLFVKMRGTTTLKCVRGKKDIYVCHRSGKFRGKAGERVRHLKSQGSQKLNAFCPARMKVITTEGDRVFLNYLPMHVGHGTDEAHLRLSRSEKEMLAQKMVLKRSYDEILEEIKNSQEDLGRLKLLTRQDLQNISRDLRILSSVYQESDIDKWVSDQKRNGSVLLYKALGTVNDSYPELNLDDFAICLMNNEQIELFSKYGMEILCLDNFEVSSSQEYNLFTIATVTDKLACPCCMMITNRNDSVIINIFLNLIHSILGHFTTRMIFCDRKSTFFDGWLKVFSEPDSKFSGSWHVDREWREVLSKTVPNKIKKLETYKIIKSLKELPDQSEFNQVFDDICGSIFSVEEIQEFNEYFRQEFLQCANEWAYCYRSSKVNEANAMFEKLYRTFHFIHLRFKSSKTVKKLVSSLEDDVSKRLIGISLKTEIHKLKDIKSRHKLALRTKKKITFESDNIWKVYCGSREVEYNYSVEKVNSSCQCLLKCDHCKYCIHAFACSCLDAIKGNMCKHIHMVCMGLTSDEGFQEANVIGEENLVVETEPTESLEVVINEGIISEDVEEGKLDIQQEFSNILSMITTLEDVNVVKNAFRLIIPTLSALKGTNTLHQIVQVNGEEHASIEIANMLKPL